MKNLRVVIIIVIIAVIAIFIVSTIRSYYLFLKEPVSLVTDALPLNSSIVIRTKSVFRLFESVNNSALVDLFDKKKAGYFKISALLDTISLKNNKLYEVLKTGEVVFALVPDITNRNKLLVAVSVGKTSSNSLNSRITELMVAQGYQVNKTVTGTYKISDGKNSAWYFISKGVLALSPDSSILISSFNTLSSGKTLTSDVSFSKLLATTGKSVDASLLINNKILAKSLWPSKAGLIAKGTPFDGWTSLDLNIKKGEVALGGFTFTQSKHLFQGQEPVIFDQLDYFPSNTALAFSISLSDQRIYIRNFNQRDSLHVQGYDASINQKTNEIFRPEDHLRAWIGNTISIIYTQDYFKGSSSEQMILISSKDPDSASWYLKPFIEQVNDSLGKMHYLSMCSDLWGNTFSLKGNIWCMITKNYVAISPGRNLLERFADSHGMKDKELKQIKEMAGQSSNVFVYMRPNAIAGWFTGKNKETDNLLVNFLSKNNSIGFQYSADNDLQYTHAWMLLNPKKNLPPANLKEEELAGNLIQQSPDDKVKDKSALDQSASTNKEIEKDIESYAEIKLRSASFPPQIVSGKSKNQKQIAVLSKKGNIAMYDHTGRMLWSFDTPESITGKLLEADILQNGKTNYIIVARKNLYILNEEGNQINGSPVKLPETVAGGASLFDYDKKKDYRLLYVGDDKRIYNVTLKGKELPDWQKPRVPGVGDITFFRLKGKDYLVYHYKDEALKIYDRRGKERIKLNTGFKASSNSSIYGNETNSKGSFLTVSADGEMVYLNNEGLISKSTFGKYGRNPWFTYMDFNADGSKDFIFAKNNRIVAYTKLKRVIAEKTLKTGTFGTPFIYSTSSKDKWIFARNISTDEVIGFNNSGKTYPYQIISETDPIIFNPGGNLKEIIITSHNGKLILRELDNL